MVLKSSRWLLAFACVSCLLAWPVIKAQTTATPSATESCVVGSERVGTAVALLDRIDRLVTAARKDLDSDDLQPTGTSGRAGASGTVEIRAADLDEIRAEIAQIKVVLGKSPQQ